MAQDLRDPDLPAGAIVKNNKDGSALRKDGVELQPANKNPWYVLATIEGEQELFGIDKDLAAKNRRYWNGWACAVLSDEQRAALAKKMGLTVADLKPLTKAETTKVMARFTAVFGVDSKRPKPDEVIDFINIYFINKVIFIKYVIFSDADFSSAHFERSADFSSARFYEDVNFGSAHFESPADFLAAHFKSFANFSSAHFERSADFSSARFYEDVNFGSAHFESPADFLAAHFESSAYFSSAHFESSADFSSAHFYDDAAFHSAHFESSAYFRDSHFESSADFSSARFLSTTSFEDVEFENSVPEFHATELYDDTVFPTADGMQGHWPPPVKRDGVMLVTDQKRAYNRLRLFMNRSLQIDEEMFFHRQEMACKAEIEKGLVRWLFKVYGAISGYGSSVVKPLVYLGLNLFVGWVGFLFYLNWAKDTLEVNPIWAAFGASFSNIFAFFGFGRLFLVKTMQALPDYMALLAASQTVFGFIFLFLLGLGLRNRFRLR